MYLLILFLPFISSVIAGFFGRYLGTKGAGVFTSTLLVITCILSWTALYEVGLSGSVTYIHLWNWIDSGLIVVPFGLLFDSITVIMLIVVTTISSLVHIYSTGYMAGDPHVPRFMSYLSLFTFFMLVLVTSNNFLQLFLGWEGIGLASYLLINFWYTRIQANKFGIKAMVVNRIGDVGFALAMFVIFDTFKSFDFDTVFAMSHLIEGQTINFVTFEVDRLTLIGVLLLIAISGKSSQLGLHTWLPDAMEGPTPVSSLIHAATLVTAGIFLLIRSSPILEYAPKALILITVIGACTAFMAATIGVVQNDIKRVIAFSTCSQLGYMCFACGLSNYATSLFHLMNHAFFKALLFLSAGVVIHAMNDEQDMRKLGGLINSLPFTYSMMLIGSLSLMGWPFLTGYYSKDAILELAYTKYTFDATFAHWLGTISAFFTAFYSFRLIYLTFLTDTNAPQSTFSIANSEHSGESPANMSIPLVILAFGSIFVGYLFKDLMIGPGTPFFGNSIFVLPQNVNIFEAEFLDPSIKFIPVIFSMIGALSGFIMYHYSLHLLPIFWSPFVLNLYTFFNSKWYFDYVYNSYIVKPAFNWGHDVSYKVLDRGFIEFFGPLGISKLIQRLSTLVSSLQSGLIYNYALTIFLFSTLFLSFFSLPSLITDATFFIAHFDLLLTFPILLLFLFSA